MIKKHIWELDEKNQKIYLLYKLIEAYYETEVCGGNLHVVLDDYNLEDEHILFCKNEAEKNNDIIGKEIVERLLKLTIKEREELSSYEYEEKIREMLND